MGNAAKLNDIGTGHDGYPPTPIIAASPTVNIDGRPTRFKSMTSQKIRPMPEVSQQDLEQFSLTESQQLDQEIL